MPTVRSGLFKTEEIFPCNIGNSVPVNYKTIRVACELLEFDNNADSSASCTTRYLVDLTGLKTGAVEDILQNFSAENWVTAIVLEDRRCKYVLTPGGSHALRVFVEDALPQLTFR